MFQTTFKASDNTLFEPDAFEDQIGAPLLVTLFNGVHIPGVLIRALVSVDLVEVELIIEIDDEYVPQMNAVNN